MPFGLSPFHQTNNASFPFRVVFVSSWNKKVISAISFQGASVWGS